jgi:hypothetical protein
MAKKSWSDIQAAADAALLRCLNSDKPMTRLSECTQALRSLEWDEESIDEFETTVMDAFDLMKHSEVLVAVAH